jgi:uncharacterized protein
VLIVRDNRRCCAARDLNGASAAVPHTCHQSAYFTTLSGPEAGPFTVLISDFHHITEGSKEYARAWRLSSVNAFVSVETSTVSPRACPPFTAADAVKKVRLIENSWNSREPNRVALDYAVDSRWRNDAEFLAGRAAIEAFLTRKWARELEYRLIAELWAFSNERLGVHVAYEFHDDSGSWFRAHGNESWEFDADGLIRCRVASVERDRSSRAIVASTGRSVAAPMGIPA